jgi:hypothetical protein
MVFENAMNDDSTVEFQIWLIDEGTDCSRPAKAVSVGNGLFKLLPAKNCDRSNPDELLVHRESPLCLGNTGDRSIECGSHTSRGWQVLIAGGSD